MPEAEFFGKIPASPRPGSAPDFSHRVNVARVISLIRVGV
jgi:hypothetical protein